MAIKIIDKNGNIEEIDQYNDKIEVFRHTAAHVLAQAVKRLYKDVKIAIGPSIEGGFYYDFDNLEITNEDLEKIEDEMKKIIKENLKIEAFILPREKAKELMKDEPYKLQLIEDLSEESEISFFKQGDYVDMCVGPHALYTKAVGKVKLFSVTGAYWKGSEKNKMLTRIYGTAYKTSEELEAEILRREDAKKRDHNKLGRELELFTTVDVIGQGLPLLMPKGATVVQTLQRFVEDEERRRGYLLTKTPFMAKSDLYKLSGHWDHYKEGMFILGDEEVDKEIFALRPMTCPFQFMVYKAKMHSYRELPFRYNETSTLFRNESSGEMHGLTRVRQFTLSEGHLVVRADQVEAEFKAVLDLIKYFEKCLGLGNEFTYRFSKWDPNNTEKYINKPEAWEATQKQMKSILDSIGLDYVEADGEAAFYGPKLDIQGKNVYGKEDTIITVQLDFALAERLDMTYIDANGEKVRPVIIHRSSIGSYERTLAMLIEKYAGAFPLWLAPVQVKILPIADAQIDYAKEVEQKLIMAGFKVEVDTSVEKLGYKIRQAQLEKVPYMVVLGQKDLEANVVSVRARDEGKDLGQMSADALVAMLESQVKEQLKK